MSHFLTLPPSDIALEKNVLSSLLNSASANIEAADIWQGAPVFYDIENAKIYDCINLAHTKYEITNRGLTLSALELKQPKELLQAIVLLKNEYGSAEHLMEACVKLKELFLLRETLASAQKLIQDINNQKDIVSATQQATFLTDALSKGYSANRDMTSERAGFEFEAFLDKPVTDGLTGIDTGLRSINEQTGGWQNNDVIIIAGRPGMGKTVAAVFHALVSAKNGIPTGYVSAEISAWQIQARMSSHLSGVPFSDILKKKYSPYHEPIIREASRALGKMPLYFYDSKQSMDINDICQMARLWKHKYGIGILFLDYIQMLSDRTIKGTEYDVVTSVSKKVKRLQAELQIPIVCAAQLKRPTARSVYRPSDGDIRNSGQIEQDASVIIGLYREDEDGLEQHKEQGLIGDYVYKNTMEYIFLKNRNGGKGVELLYCNIGTNKLKDL